MVPDVPDGTQQLSYYGTRVIRFVKKPKENMVDGTGYLLDKVGLWG